MSYTPLILLLLASLAGCATRKECNITLINHRHPGELSAILKEHESLTMDLLHTIAVLEQEAGHYR
jgi:hypothetical protein